MAYGKKKCGAKCPCSSCKKKTMKMGSRKAPKKAARKRK